ncbi:hypothetical protein L2E82_06732 [Cichorium intybus]|uniref:Uncharacterized protein n=1 Tax=Cichorium intybus TaxID=13427 RepID=A0ACB9HBX4_CICIN|nr:hypothetical protein L2E82_06732 [Cichorium intybus]
MALILTNFFMYIKDIAIYLLLNYMYVWPNRIVRSCEREDAQITIENSGWRCLISISLSSKSLELGLCPPVATLRLCRLPYTSLETF